MGGERAQDTASLLQRTARGDREAFTCFYDRYASLVFTFAIRLLRASSDAEDLLQDVFLHVWYRAATYAPERGSPEAWLITITRSRALDRLRSRQRREKRVVLLEEPAQLEEIEGEVPAAAPLGEREIIAGALAQLPDVQRTALELAYFEGFTQSEIAARVGVPLGTVKTRIHDGLLHLRKQFQAQAGRGQDESRRVA
ncbi:MAG: sigma-70 family RNA polymerase sigma factor [Candidatus Omnitrophica bacterium]|nr:sigma-70 family RNA polymerase sigma factor [Candidatus Omnitrophota bacterium]